MRNRSALGVALRIENIQGILFFFPSPTTFFVSLQSLRCNAMY